MTAPRRRLPPEESRRRILDAARALLVEGGHQNVTTRAVAARAGLTDMGVLHHFGSREGLLGELLDDAAGRLRARMAELARRWRDAGAEPSRLVDELHAFYDEEHARLALVLHEAGWRYRGAPLLAPLFDVLDELPGRAGVRLTLAALHQAVALERVVGVEFRRSAGLRAVEATDSRGTLAWWARTASLWFGDGKPSPRARQGARSRDQKGPR
jgi:TetR/AcrR family transcriptional regulator, repressor for neighboring sulfatase